MKERNTYPEHFPAHAFILNEHVECMIGKPKSSIGKDLLNKEMKSDDAIPKFHY